MSGIPGLLLVCLLVIRTCHLPFDVCVYTHTLTHTNTGRCWRHCAVCETEAVGGFLINAQSLRLRRCSADKTLSFHVPLIHTLYHRLLHKIYSLSNRISKTGKLMISPALKAQRSRTNVLLHKRSPVF